MNVNDLRESFLQFFKDRGHRVIPSSSLVPRDDPSLLFTTAGMVQFKPMFAGTVKLEYTRAASIQKCLRTSDLENVGKTGRHCTFFEMLGNFSFGDYFKKEAIQYAWDYSTDVIGFPREDIWISIYEEDDESFELWNRMIGIPAPRIVRLGKKDNFWGPAGDSGACGPCSELYLDRGPGHGCGSSDCRPGCDCDRFLEYWNLVFNQYYQNEQGEFSPLPQTGIDTGMGLERLATLVRNVDTIYHTDELYRLVEFVCREAGVEYKGDAVMPVNVLVEHSRALTFAVSDGVYPSNEGRGYVLRRILRRALRYGRHLGIGRPFVYKMVTPLADLLGDRYPEIRKAAPNTQRVLEGEEQRFLETLENGMDRLEETMKSLRSAGKDVMSGVDAFILYDTFGFPLEMTVEIAGENGIAVDTRGFEEQMEKQRERGKQSWKADGQVAGRIFEELAGASGETEFRGYDHDETETEIIALGTLEAPAEGLIAGDRGVVVTRSTSFYGEAGGQVGDRGTITSPSGALFRVDDTKKLGKTIVHVGEMIEGGLKVGEPVLTSIDVIRRNLIRANHTATHLLQAALRKVLGGHVHQAGSLVDPDHLRFDFTHFKALTEDEVAEVEKMVNDAIWKSMPVITEIKPLEEALKAGAMAVFDEKYEDTVRLVRVPDFSMELCGGTHTDNTGKIGVFRIVREASPGSGMRRIEAITLREVLERFKAQSAAISALSQDLNVAEGDVAGKVRDLMDRIRALEKELERKNASTLTLNVDEIISKAVTINETKIISHRLNGAGVEELRKLSDVIRARERNALVCLGSVYDDNPLLLCSTTSSVVGRGADCHHIIQSVSRYIDGRGGGRKDMAQAGGKNTGGLDKALEEAVRLAGEMVVRRP